MSILSNGFRCIHDCLPKTKSRYGCQGESSSFKEGSTRICINDCCIGGLHFCNDDGIISDEGINAEKKLYVLLNGLDNLGIIDFDEDRCDRVIDEIISE